MDLGQRAPGGDLGTVPFDRAAPYNTLPPLPPRAELETISALKRSAKIQVALAELRESGAFLPNQSFLVRALQIQEAKQSSEIENIVTTNDVLYAALDETVEVRDPTTREVLRYSDALWAGYQALANGRPVSPSVILEVVRTIKFPEIGPRTMPGTKIANSVTGEVVYTPPVGTERILWMLDNLCDYWAQEDESDPIIKMAVGHYQFEAIHPFPDGNGRTGRILMMLFLLSQGLLHVPTMYLSRPIFATKTEYYRRLQAVTELQDWKGWVEYMLDVAHSAAVDALARVRNLQRLIERVTETAREGMKAGYSIELVHLIFQLPYTRIRSLERAGIAKRDAASAYLRDLERLGILRRVKSGRDVLYINEPYLRALID